jgi:hypothetical protein
MRVAGKSNFTEMNFKPAHWNVKKSKIYPLIVVLGIKKKSIVNHAEYDICSNVEWLTLWLLIERLGAHHSISLSY